MVLIAKKSSLTTTTTTAAPLGLEKSCIDVGSKDHDAPRTVLTPVGNTVHNISKPAKECNDNDVSVSSSGGVCKNYVEGEQTQQQRSSKILKRRRQHQYGSIDECKLTVSDLPYHSMIRAMGESVDIEFTLYFSDSVKLLECKPPSLDDRFDVYLYLRLLDVTEAGAPLMLLSSLITRMLMLLLCLLILNVRM